MNTLPTTKTNPHGAQDPRLTQITAALRRVQVRLRLQEAAILAPLAACLGLGAAVLLAVVWRLVPQMRLSLAALLLVGGGLVAAALLTVLLYALFRPRNLMSAARRADALLKLDERLSTALEDSSRTPSNPTGAHLRLRGALLDDALAAATRIQPSRDLPVRVQGRRLAPAGLMLALLFAVLVAPSFAPGGEAALQKQVAIEQSKIEAMKKAVEFQPRVAEDPTLQELLAELQRLSRDLSEERLSREEAMARLSQAESELQKGLDPQAPAQKEALQELAKQLADSENPVARQAGEALQSQDPEEVEKALEEAAQNLDALSPQEQKELAQALREARDSVVGLDPELARRLNEAAEALDANNTEAAEDALNKASEHVAESSRNLATQEQLRGALAQIQQSKGGIAQAGQPTSVAGTALAGTMSAQRTALANRTSLTLSGSPVAMSGSPVSGTPITGTVVAAGSPVQGQPARTGTPVLAQGNGGGGTPVAGQGQGQGQGQAQGQAPGSGWGSGHMEPVYAPPSSIDAGLTPVAVQGQGNTGEQSSATTNNGPNTRGNAQVPYSQVYGEYKEQAGNALDNDYIPQGYKDLVRDYFTDIEPPPPPPSQP